MRFSVTVGVLFGVFSVITGIHTAAHAQSMVHGTIQASTPCNLSPSRGSENMVCAQMILPIKARLVLTSERGKRFTVFADTNGLFKRSLPPGRYTIRLAGAFLDGKPIPAPARDLRLTETSLVVRRIPVALDLGVYYDPTRRLL
jgi:hypothetical protein